MWVDAPWRAARSLAHVPGCSCVPWCSREMSQVSRRTTTSIPCISGIPWRTPKQPPKLQMSGFNVWVHVPNPKSWHQLRIFKRKWSIQNYSVLLVIHQLKQFFQAIMYGTCLFSSHDRVSRPNDEKRTRSCLPSSWFQVHLFQSPVNPEALLLCRCFNLDTAKTDSKLDITEHNYHAILYHAILQKWLFHGVSL